jgi:hypothetical protein
VLHPITDKRPPRRHGDAGAQLLLGMGASLQWPSDDGYRVAGIGDRQAHFDLFATYDVAKLSENWVLAAGASFLTLGGADEKSVELSLRTLQADLTLRYRGCDWFVPHLRAAAGATFLRLEIEDTELATSYEGKARTFAGNLGAGFTLRTKTRFFETDRGRLASLSFGLRVEGGMVLAPVADPKLEIGSNVAEGIEQRQAELGKLDLSAPYLRLAVVTRF